MKKVIFKSSVIGLVIGIILVVLIFLEPIRYKIYGFFPKNNLFYKITEGGLAPAISYQPRIFLMALVLFIVPILIGYFIGFIISKLRKTKK